jgi:hypothetical protein
MALDRSSAYFFLLEFDHADQRAFNETTHR